MRRPTRPSKPKTDPANKIRFLDPAFDAKPSPTSITTGQSIPHFDACPITQSTSNSALRAHTTRQGHPRSTQSTRIWPASFFRPLSIWGGKSGGYALGFESSWAVSPELAKFAREKHRLGLGNSLQGNDSTISYRQGWKYRRDTMK